MIDQLVAETSTWQVTRDKYPCPGGIRTQNSSKQAALDSRFKTEPPMGSACFPLKCMDICFQQNKKVYRIRVLEFYSITRYVCSINFFGFNILTDISVDICIFITMLPPSVKYTHFRNHTSIHSKYAYLQYNNHANRPTGLLDKQYVNCRYDFITSNVFIIQ